MSAAPHSRFHARSAVQQRPLFALGLRLLSALLFSVVLLLVKLITDRGMWFPEMLFWRQVLPTVVLLVWLVARGQLHRLRTARPLVHARRAAIGTFSMFFTLGVVLLLPLAEATVLGFTAPLFAVILSVVLLRETVGVWRIGAVLLGLGGVVIMANPWHAYTGHHHLPVLGLLVGIIAAFLVALISIQLRDLGRTEEPITIVFYFCAMSVPVLALLLPFVPAGYDRAFHHDAIGWLMIGGIGLLGMFSQLLMTSSLRYGRVSSVIVMDYAQFGWSTLWGWLVFAHLPPATTWIGAPAIIAAGSIIAWREHVRSTRGLAADTVAASVG
ncbi:DMT family transporter [Novosphingobium sp.]|uniref:DMT family transporter n=1 Tax=Novosphingobium sp. TaxID=1874826 RepID=UPI0033407E1C